MQNESEIAISAVREAGEILRKAFRGDFGSVRLKEDRSPVTDTDLQSHELIVRRLRSAFPSDHILSEEQDGAKKTALTNSRTWVLDPLDGTSNFISGIPLFGIALALIENGESRLGIIYDPLHDDLFFAEAGRGATLNEKPIHVSERDTPAKAMLFAGRGNRQEHRDRHGKIIFALESKTNYFRRLGSAAVMLSSVAAGRADAVIMTGSSPWDMIAGGLLIKEAGGSITDYCGNDWHPGSPDLVASNGSIHQQLIAITHGLEDIC